MSVAVYLVGGAVRDKLLGRAVSDRDWVVVGADYHDMIEKGFKPVGKDFPVFLHPDSKEEYALARTERKTGKGYRGFSIAADKTVTLEQDLARRDLTINAMAESASGELIDPFGGQKDLAAGVLRHVSAAFVEDPVRVLRIARFAARYDFSVAAETLDLMREMVAVGEVAHLVAERIWQEVSRALMETYPARFFEVLSEVGAEKVLLPGITINLDGLQAALTADASATLSLEQRYALLFAQNDKAQIMALNARWKVPKLCAELAVLLHQLGQQLGELAQINRDIAPSVLAKAHLQLLKQSDALRRAERFDALMRVSALAWQVPYAVLQTHWQQAVNCLQSIDYKDITRQSKASGKRIDASIEQAQLCALEAWLYRAYYASKVCRGARGA